MKSPRNCINQRNAARKANGNFTRYARRGRSGSATGQLFKCTRPGTCNGTCNFSSNAVRWNALRIHRWQWDYNLGKKGTPLEAGNSSVSHVHLPRAAPVSYTCYSFAAQLERRCYLLFALKFLCNIIIWLFTMGHFHATLVVLNYICSWVIWKSLLTTAAVNVLTLFLAKCRMIDKHTLVRSFWSVNIWDQDRGYSSINRSDQSCIKGKINQNYLK